ncbi:hypothetical protein [Candidatus Nitrospira allomarina]|uniref:Lipoprotein n=1 Tax=Candidatus Nitrospira allomarina TaxID=3020900 RepID=A0AA96GJP9_9BACT|nr:hypothetical protein [Candidatus Nitrospira allomarina]WNM59659.1 hypothetical protein PP769_07860 [Candidatus Nitrospira allomarina]
MMNLKFPARDRRVPLMMGLAMVSMLTLILGCQQQHRVDSVVIKPNTCPLPEDLSTDDQHKVKKFGAEISGLMTSLAGGKLDADVQSALKRNYPDAGDVNRIYAMSYAACVSCRVDPNDVKGCAQRFDDIIDKFTPQETAPSHPAKGYRSKLLEPLRGAK